MSQGITIILAKASWCPHCIDFTPIYELAMNKINPEKQLEGTNINFVSFELDKEIEKTRFINEYPGLIDFLEGYPTVYFQLSGDNGRPKTEFINHTVSREQGNKGLEKAAEEFIENIVNKYKSIKSGKKEIVRVQKGGMHNFITSLEEEEYRNKYLKYKSKYLGLKNTKK